MVDPTKIIPIVDSQIRWLGSDECVQEIVAPRWVVTCHHLRLQPLDRDPVWRHELYAYLAYQTCLDCGNVVRRIISKAEAGLADG